MRFYLNNTIFVLLFILFGCWMNSAPANDLTGLTVGIEGLYKNGFWTPITINTGISSGTVELSSVDSDGTPVVTRQPLKGGTQTLYFPLGRSNGAITIRLIGENESVLTEQRFEPQAMTSKGRDQDRQLELPQFFFSEPQSAHQPLVLLVGDENIGLQEALGELRIKEEHRPIVKRIRHFKSLPDQWIGYEAVETLILTSTDPDFFNSVQWNDPRMLAIAQWVQSGGRLVIFGGRDSIPLLTGNGALSRLVPGLVDEKLREIRIANSITQYVPKAKNLVMTGSLDAPFLNTPILKEIHPDAVVELAEMETPILVRRPYGLGTTTFFAVDLALPPVASWSGRSGLLIKMLGLNVDSVHHVSGEGMLVQLGFTDLSGQLRSTLDRFEGVRNVPFSIILLLAFLYILLIGPGDWYLTHKILKKPNLTWFTFPIYIIIMCVFVVWLNERVKPHDVKLNRVDMIDVDESSGTVRGTSWAAIYSPNDARYDFELTLPEFKPYANRTDSSIPVLGWDKPWSSLSWLGLQGTGLGAMSPKTIAIPFWHEPYTLGSPSSILTGVPVQVHATKSLSARWLYQELPGEKSQLKDFDSVPIGSVVNPYSEPLENAILYYKRWALNLGTLPPGKTELDIKTPKTERHLVIGTAEDPFAALTSGMTQRGLTRYNTESHSIPYMLRAMTFYRIIGGRDALGLYNSLQHYVDLSEQLQFGRAVLTATVRDRSQETLGATPAFPLESGLNIKGHDRASCQRSVLIRMILPVGK